jgi:hypothetical protein
MSVPFDWRDFPPEVSSGDVSSSYVSGSAEYGFTKVTYGTAEGTSYEYVPPFRIDIPINDDISLDSNRPISVEDDLADE